MSYDFYIAVDTGGEEPHYIEPYFNDVLPGFADDGMAGTAILTASGHARCGNYTSNVSPMWARCLTGALEVVPEAKAYVGDDDRYMIERYGMEREISTDRLCLADLQGKRAGDLVPLLRAAVAWGQEHIEELRELNPENGWGNAEGAVTYLWDIRRFCERHPNGELELSH